MEKIMNLLSRKEETQKFLFTLCTLFKCCQTLKVGHGDQFDWLIVIAIFAKNDDISLLRRQFRTEFDSFQAQLL